MLNRRRDQKTTATKDARAFDDFHEWVLSLPWVVERPYSLGTPGVRSFGIDCEPLGRRQLWLVTGLRELAIGGIGLAVIVPRDAAREIERAGWGRRLAPMPGQHEMITVSHESLERREELEALVLTAYGYAMS